MISKRSASSDTDIIPDPDANSSGKDLIVGHSPPILIITVWGTDIRLYTDC